MDKDSNLEQIQDCELWLLKPFAISKNYSYGDRGELTKDSATPRKQTLDSES